MNSNDSELLQSNVERVAYRLWEERGRPHGSPEEDWYRAEHEVAALKVSPVSSAKTLVTGQ
jgi:Protein of unknown function (DUF2934)